MNATRQPWQDVLDAAVLVGPATTSTIARVSGWGERTTRRCLRALMAAGTVAYTRRDGWRVVGRAPRTLVIAPERYRPGRGDRRASCRDIDFAILDALHHGPATRIDLQYAVGTYRQRVHCRLNWMTRAGVVLRETADDVVRYRLAPGPARSMYAVLSALSARPTSVQELADLARVSDSTARNMLRDLRTRGLALRTDTMPFLWRRA